MEHPPYHIRHINLGQQLSMPSLETASGGYYLVFWWQEVPLGHFYIQAGETITEEMYFTRLVAAVVPTLQYYSSKKGDNTAWESMLKAQQTEAWNNQAATVLASLFPAQLPQQVALTVVICTRNRAAFLQRCLEMLSHLPCRPAEILVVDNAPSDTRTKEVADLFPEVTYCLESRAGLDIARNTGIREASYPLVAFLDDDVTPHPHWVYRVWEAFQEPGVAAITGLVIASELQTRAQQIFEEFWSFNRGYVPKQYGRAYFQQTLAQGPPVWEIGAGANMAFRKEIFQHTGYFNKLLDVGAAGCNGDSEMWFRILANGYTIAYCPLAVVHHEHRREIQGLRKQIYFYMRGFAAAALLQQQQQQQAGYKKHLFQVLPRYYAKLLRQGFPRYTKRYSTLVPEIRGMLSGILFYQKNKKQALEEQHG